MKTVVSRWGEHGDRPKPLRANDELFGALYAEASVEVACSPTSAWNLITNIERIGEFSPECIEARWLDGASGPSVGARFEGTNRTVFESDDFEYIWIRPCTITVASRPQRFGYTVGDRYDGTAATEWQFRIDATTTGCRITEQFRHLRGGLSGIRHRADATPAEAAAIVTSRADQLTAGMTETLQRMKLALEAAP